MKSERACGRILQKNGANPAQKCTRTQESPRVSSGTAEIPGDSHNSEHFSRPPNSRSPSPNLFENPLSDLRSTFPAIHCVDRAGVAKWQTRRIQNPVGLKTCVGSSPTSGSQILRQAAAPRKLSPGRDRQMQFAPFPDVVQWPNPQNVAPDDFASAAASRKATPEVLHTVSPSPASPCSNFASKTASPLTFTSAMRFRTIEPLRASGLLTECSGSPCRLRNGRTV